MKSTNLVFVLKNIGWIYMQRHRSVFVLKNIDWIFMKRHRSGFFLEKEQNENLMIDFLADIRF